jgi:small subunit ribosomal protein YMR-31
MTYGRIGGTPGQSLGPVKPQAGEFFDRDELPKRFRRKAWSEEEIEAVTSGGASMFA